MSEIVRPRRVFTDEFKRAAVRLAGERGNVEQTARDLGIHANLIHEWKRRLATKADRETAFPDHGNAKDPEPVRLQLDLDSIKVLRLPLGFEGRRRADIRIERSCGDLKVG